MKTGKYIILRCSLFFYSFMLFSVLFFLSLYLFLFLLRAVYQYLEALVIIIILEERFGACQKNYFYPHSKP